MYNWNEPSELEKVTKYLADPYYAKLRKFNFQIAAPNWKPEYYSDPYGNISIQLMAQIAEHCDGSDNFKLYYDPREDFHHVEFDYNGDSYDIRWYKVYSMTRKSDGKSVLFGRIGNGHQIVDFFKNKTQRGWL